MARVRVGAKADFKINSNDRSVPHIVSHKPLRQDSAIAGRNLSILNSIKHKLPHVIESSGLKGG